MFQDLCVYYFLELTILFKSDVHSLKSEVLVGICAFIHWPVSRIDAVLACGVRSALSQSATLRLQSEMLRRRWVVPTAPHTGAHTSP